MKPAIDATSPIEKTAVYVVEGQRYCFYFSGWHGAGWYRCGFAHRHGLGWGGVYGWQGWQYGPAARRFGHVHGGARVGTNFHEGTTVRGAATIHEGSRVRSGTAVRSGASARSNESIRGRTTTGSGATERGMRSEGGGARINAAPSGGAKVQGGGKAQGGAAVQGGGSGQGEKH
jgi:hypothetical protein